jgi:SNF2 family DNA or RNA helicase
MREIKAGFTWFITATPIAMINKHSKCRTSYMSRIIPHWTMHEHIFSHITVKNDDNFIKASFEMPATHHHYYHCYSPLYTTVNGLVSNKLTKLIEAGNISGAIKALGGKKTDNITDLIRIKKQQELEEISSKVRIWEIRGNKNKIKIWKERENRITLQINELEKRYRAVLDGECPICRDVINKPVMEPSCQNIFCGGCLLPWLQLKGDCPLCRRDVNVKELTYITEEGDQEEKTESPSEEKTKETVIVELIKSKPKGRFIIFSNWDSTFVPIRNTLNASGIKFVEVKGSVKTRARILNKFREGKERVMFLNSQYNGSGINLQETTDIILYHKMGPNTRQQIMGRANRIGRKVPLQVHHLLYQRGNEV